MRPAKKSDPKSEALKKRGCRNAHPERVIDELFLDLEFFDARDLVQVKYEMLRRVEQEGWSVTESAKTFGFSRVAFYRALAAFQKAGISGLAPRRRGPRGAHKLSDEVMGFLRRAQEENPGLPAKELPRLVKEQFGFSVHRRSIERALRRPQKKG